MYVFICSGTPPHFSHSASKTQFDPSCPTCGASTQLVLTEGDQEARLAEDHNLSLEQMLSLAEHLKDRGCSETRIAHIMRLETTELRALVHRARTEAGEKARELVNDLKQKGYANEAIAQRMGVSENTVRKLLTPEQAAAEQGRLAENHSLSHEQMMEMAKELEKKGYSNASIAYIMRISENKVWNILVPTT